MGDLRTRTIVERRINIGGDGAWVSREGDRIKISYDPAGRVTKADQHFFASDIRLLALFVQDTDPQ